VYCLICNHKTEEYRDIQLNIKTYKCPNCSYIFKDTDLFAPLSEQKNRYDLHQNDPDDEGYRAYFQSFLDYVLPLTTNVKTALDFGCGKSSLLSNMMIENGIDSNYYDPIYHPDKSTLDSRCDLITSVEVFEHLHDPVDVFGKLLLQLNDGGYLAIRTEFAPSEMSEYFSWYYRQDPTHIGFFSRSVFEYLAERFGCEYVGDNGKNVVVFCVNRSKENH